ncbi:SIMPL domain-containing protein [Paenibacillus sp. CAA11]|uniref:SIMPL domain-containing protein n=1 Tax=Paenibacillus sp. CAA11 TaxID=1532905 RepID=UPI000D3DC745|nr:SIMPL domain-containing protein [Paenibacillus sp. CAA11]AWB42927.1 SIMPL domain-containing protein [Paenibacillus sp. CAA11]
MKFWIKPLAVTVITSAMVFGGATASIWGQQAAVAYADEAVSQQNTVNVVGTGKLTVKPDVAYISLGVETTAGTAAEAQSKNAAIIQKLNTLLKNTWKVEAKDLQTGQFYVQPNYVYNDKDGQKVNGYIARHTLQVTYRQLDKIGQLLDDASKAGANKIDNIRFTVEDEDQFQTEAINKAMANASMKASAIAKAANRQLGSVLNVTQGSGGVVAQYDQAYSVKSTAESASASTVVEPGTIELTTTLSVQYALK